MALASCPQATFILIFLLGSSFALHVRQRETTLIAAPFDGDEEASGEDASGEEEAAATATATIESPPRVLLVAAIAREIANGTAFNYERLFLPPPPPSPSTSSQPPATTTSSVSSRGQLIHDGDNHAMPISTRIGTAPVHAAQMSSSPLIVRDEQDDDGDGESSGEEANDVVHLQLESAEDQNDSDESRSPKLSTDKSTPLGKSAIQLLLPRRTSVGAELPRDLESFASLKPELRILSAETQLNLTLSFAPLPNSRVQSGDESSRLYRAAAAALQRHAPHVRSVRLDGGYVSNPGSRYVSENGR